MSNMNTGIIPHRRDTKRTWILVYQEPRGHRLWRDFETGRLAIADTSGDGFVRGTSTGTPDDTEDGSLWFPQPTELVVRGGSDSAPCVQIRVIEESGLPTHVMVSPLFASMLVTQIHGAVVLHEPFLDPLSHLLRRSTMLIPSKS